MQALARRVTRLMAAPLRTARAAGTVRADLKLTDVLGALAMVSAVVAGEAEVGVRRRRARRALELLVHGLAARHE